MKTLVFLSVVIAVSSAASILTMDDSDFEKVMMAHLASQGVWLPARSLRTLMDNKYQEQQKPEAAEAENETRDETEANQKEMAVKDPRPIPYAAKNPCPRPAATNNKRKPAGQRKPTNVGQGQRGSASGAAASAVSFSKGPNSFSGSQAQAFSRGS
ncbi:uncharacterized protein LOC124174011 [Ischnura elegans]|uniref:uncharacterized protein LOC124174011 n=1 Tax=Ischnura elegans TaxID=197161 RepID=UPI001ED884C2|nr:uncharacterized protein LOC124174011 [Ischnura elegans]